MANVLMTWYVRAHINIGRINPSEVVKP